MLYLGIDIGKSHHLAAFLSGDLLARHMRYDACPTLAIENTRAGFDRLRAAIRQHADEAETCVLLERTGHYGASLEAYLSEQGCHLYWMQARARYANNKTDRQDARALVVLLYNELELHAPTVDERLRISPIATPGREVRTLHGLVHHRDELVAESTRRKNKLTAILDELFPEFVAVYHDPFTPSALACREQFPTPTDVAEADIEDVCHTRKRNQPSRADLMELQTLARATIGTRDGARVASLLVEQKQLIAELHLMMAHVEQLDGEIERLVASSRAGQILLSFPGVASVQAGKLLAGIGTISNFESEAKLRGYLGWAPQSAQTGTSMDSSSLSKGGNPLLKKTVFMIVMTAIRSEPWKSRYAAMVARKCNYDGRRKEYTGRMKVVGHLCGHFIRVLYTLLKRDADLLADLPAGTEPPPPECYDPARHITGQKKAGGTRH